MKRTKQKTREQKLSYIVEFCTTMGIPSKVMVSTGNDNLSTVKWGKVNTKRLIKSFFRTLSKR